jgi:hypothetical protein
MAKKQTSFGQFDTGGAVARQREEQKRAEANRAENAARDAEKAKKAGKRLTLEQKLAIQRRNAQTTDSNN